MIPLLLLVLLGVFARSGPLPLRALPYRHEIVWSLTLVSGVSGLIVGGLTGLAVAVLSVLVGYRHYETLRFARRFLGEQGIWLRDWLGRNPRYLVGGVLILLVLFGSDRLRQQIICWLLTGLILLMIVKRLGGALRLKRK